MAAEGRTEKLGWMVALGLVLGFAITQLDPSLLRSSEPWSTAAAVLPTPALAPALAPAEEPAAEVHEEPVAEPYALLAAEAAEASGAEIPAVDRRLASAERDHTTDYRYTYERAGLAVFGRHEHHEAFHLLRKAAEKAIATEQADDMLARLERDGAPNGRLRKLAVGHAEWKELRKALEARDPDRLWHKPAHKPHRKAAHAHQARAPKPGPEAKHTAEPAHRREVPTRLLASALLKDRRPCQALLALRAARPDPRLAAIYERARGACLGDLDSHASH